MLSSTRSVIPPNLGGRIPSALGERISPRVMYFIYYMYTVAQVRRVLVEEFPGVT